MTGVEGHRMLGWLDKLQRRDKEVKEEQVS
jgi:hypothetical protein